MAPGAAGTPLLLAGNAGRAGSVVTELPVDVLPMDVDGIALGDEAGTEELPLLPLPPPPPDDEGAPPPAGVDDGGPPP